MRTRLRFVWLAAFLAATATVLVAVSGTGARTAAVGKIGIATPEKANDKGWNQQGVQGAKNAAKAFGATVTVADGIGYENTEPVLRQLAQGGADLIIAQASGYNTVAPRIGEEFQVPILTYDNPKGRKAPYVADIETVSQQGAYLAGVLAGSMVSSSGRAPAAAGAANTIGIVISAADTNWYKQSGGFIAGARSVNPKVKILFAQVGQAAYADAAGGKRTTQSLIAGGASVIFGMGDGASFGMLQAVETAARNVLFIDVIGNKTSLDKKHRYLSSVIWDFTQVFKQAIRDVNAGKFGTHNYFLGVNDGISLLKTSLIPASVWTKIQTARAGLVSGRIHVPLTPTKAAVDKLLK